MNEANFMSLRTVSLIFFLLLISSTISSTINTGYGLSKLTLISNNTKNSLTLTIISANYTNIDNDDVLDILAFFDIDATSDNPQSFKLSAILTLPSSLWLTPPGTIQPG